MPLTRIRAVPAFTPPKEARKVSSSPTAKGTGAKNIVAVDVSAAGWALAAPAARSVAAPASALRVIAATGCVIAGAPRDRRWSFAGSDEATGARGRAARTVERRGPF